MSQTCRASGRSQSRFLLFGNSRLTKAAFPQSRDCGPIEADHKGPSRDALTDFADLGNKKAPLTLSGAARASCTVVAASMLLRRFDRRVDDTSLRFLFPAQSGREFGGRLGDDHRAGAGCGRCRAALHVVDVPQHFQLGAPGCCDGLHLSILRIVGRRLSHTSVLLGTVATSCVVEPKVSIQLEPATATPRVLRQLLGQLLGRRNWSDAPNAIFVHHDSPPLPSCSAMKVGQ